MLLTHIILNGKICFDSFNTKQHSLYRTVHIRLHNAQRTLRVEEYCFFFHYYLPGADPFAGVIE